MRAKPLEVFMQNEDMVCLNILPTAIYNDLFYIKKQLNGFLKKF